MAHDGHFDVVMVHGQPGRWKRKEEAMAAAALAYQTWLEESSSDPAGLAGEQGARADHGEAVDDRDRRPTGVLGHLRSLVRAWRTIYRSDRAEPVP